MELHQKFAEKNSVNIIEDKCTRNGGSDLAASVSMSKRTGMSKGENSNSIACTPKSGLRGKSHLPSSQTKPYNMKRKREGNVEYANGTSKLAQDNQAIKRQKLDGGRYRQVPPSSNDQNHEILEVQASDDVVHNPINEHVDEGPEIRVRGQENQGGTEDTDVKVDDNKLGQASKGIRYILVRHDSLGRYWAWLDEGGGPPVPFNTHVATREENGDTRMRFWEGNGEPAQVREIRGFFQLAVPYVLQTFIGLIFYITFGALFYYSIIGEDLHHLHLKGVVSYNPRDALYFLMVTMSSTGYGDICTWSDGSYVETPSQKTPTSAKVFVIFMMLLGCGYVAGRLYATFRFLANALGNWFFDYMGQLRGSPVPGNARAKWRFWFAVGAVFFCIGFGMIGGKKEKLGWVDSIYFSVATVLSVGYGDFSYSSSGGRWFAIWWLPISTTIVNVALGYLSQLGF